jgi:hypothetical protein
LLFENKKATDASSVAQNENNKGKTALEWFQSRQLAAIDKKCP